MKGGNFGFCGGGRRFLGFEIWWIGLGEVMGLKVLILVFGFWFWFWRERRG